MSDISLPKVFGSSVKGSMHVTLKTPCQDNLAIKKLSSGGIVIAVADGLGSVAHSEHGSRLAVNTAVAEYEALITGASPPADFKSAAEETLKRCLRKMEAKASEEGWTLRDLACTMILVVCDKRGVWAAHIGDGAVVARTKDGLVTVSSPGDSEYANEVSPLTGKWDNAMRFSGPIPDVREIAVFTDGCQRAAFFKQTAHEGFFNPLFNFAQKLTDMKEGEKELTELLNSPKICENSDDDKTLVVAVLQAWKGPLPVSNKSSNREAAVGPGAAIPPVPKTNLLPTPKTSLPPVPKTNLPSVPKTGLVPASASPPGDANSDPKSPDGENWGNQHVTGVDLSILVAFAIVGICVAGYYFAADLRSQPANPVLPEPDPITISTQTPAAPADGVTVPKKPNVDEIKTVTTLFSEKLIRDCDGKNFFELGGDLEKKGQLAGAYVAFKLASDLDYKKKKATERYEALDSNFTPAQHEFAFKVYLPIYGQVEVRRAAIRKVDEARRQVTIDWVLIPGATFKMGSTRNEQEGPVHDVKVQAFQMSKTEVTVAQYNACIAEKEKCTSPTMYGCNKKELDHPINCVSWDQADNFCRWAGGRLPTEAEWEFAARRAGKDSRYPWGDSSATCAETAVMSNDKGPGCGTTRTASVCSKLKGNSPNGLCDMAGNVSEWTQDWYHETYTLTSGSNAPIDGTAWENPIGNQRSVRGGSFRDDDLRNTRRWGVEPSQTQTELGFRCVKK